MMNQKQHELIDECFGHSFFDATEVLGAPFQVLLADGFSNSLDSISGKRFCHIDDLSGLFAALVRARVLHSRKLSGHDLKFVRKVLAMMSQDLAEKLDLSAEHYSRCENDARSLSLAQEKHYRMVVYLEVTKSDLQFKRFMEVEKPKKQDDESMRKAVLDFCKFFLEMKIVTVYDASDRLKFSLSRGISENCVSPSDPADGDWTTRHPIAA
jgi:DNA-binding transcriptional regulator YiaG